jgi:heptosyltransferase-2
VEHYAAVARALEPHAEVVLVGDASDAWVRPAFADVAVTDRIGGIPLAETLTFFRGCTLTISHDTGPMHLVRLAGSHLLALFGPTDPSERVPEDERTTVLWGGAHLACRPCYDGRNYAPCADNVCLSSIGPDVVVRTARALLVHAAGEASHRQRISVVA